MTREEREAAISTLEYIKEYCHYEYEKDVIDKVQEELEQEPILDKIKLEIELRNSAAYMGEYNAGLRDALKIIDKYKAESESEK